MKTSKPSSRLRIAVPVLIILALLAGAAWLYFRPAAAISNELTASGTVEAVEVLIASEMAGRVVEVMVEEGNAVNGGDPLFRLDDELLQSQRKQAVATLEAAQENLTTAQTGLSAAEVTLNSAKVSAEVANVNAEAELLPLQQALDDLNKNADIVKADAERAVAAANRAVREATYLLDNYTVPTEQQNKTAKEAVVLMKERLDKARAKFEPYKYAASTNATRQDLKDALDEAQSNYDSSVRRLEYETSVQQAQARLDKAIRDLKTVQDGPDPDQVAVLEARIAAVEATPKQAQAAVEQAQVGVTQAQARLEQAKAAVIQAQAGLDLIDVQLKKLLVLAPTSGVILSRDIEPGEVIQAGATAMTVGQIDNITITVYVPEDRYGQIKLGEPARVTVDSFPGKAFSATVSHIADKAEFTPRNVQTVEGRKNTVFAVRLSIANPDQALKPGMPADVTFQ